MAFGTNIPGANVVISASDETRAAFDSVNGRLTSLSASVGRSIAGLSAITLTATAAFTAFMRRSAESIDTLSESATAYGVSIEALSQYRLATELAGASIDDFGRILQRQGVAVGDAVRGTGQAKEALRELGLEARELAKLPLDQQFEVIADAMANVEDRTERLSLAADIFGKGSLKPLINLIEGGGESLRGFREEADRLGLTITKVQADQMVKLNDRFDTIKLAALGASQQLAISFGPAIDSIATKALEAAVNLAQFVDGMRAIENRTNIGGIKESLKELSDEYAGLIAERAKLQSMRPDLYDPELEGKISATLRKIGTLSARLNELQDQSSQILPTAPDFEQRDLGSAAGDSANTKAERDASKAQAELDRIREQAASRLEVINESLMNEAESENNAFQNRLLILEENYELELISMERYQSIRESLTTTHEERIAKIQTDAAKKVHDYQLKQRTDIYNQSINLLTMMGTKSKAFGAAAILIESVIAAKKIFIESQVAAAAALTPPPVGLGPVAGQPLAAAIIAAGKVSAGLTLATGALSLGSLGTGGGGAQGIYNADPLTGLPESTAAGRTDRTTKTDITINLSGASLLSADAVRTLIEKINEQIDDGVVVGSIRVA